MRIGVNTWSFGKGIGIRDALGYAARIGYDGLEPMLGEEILGEDAGSLEEQWREVAAEAAGLGLEIPSVATTLYWRINPLEKPREALRVLEKQCVVASATRARVILVVPGTALPHLGYRENIERAAEWLRRAGEVAESYNVYIGVENVWNRYLASPLDYALLLERTDHPRVRVYLDVGNTLPHSLPEHWIDELGEHIVQVHVKDYDLSTRRFGVPLNGSVAWPRVMERLRGTGYTGYLVAEVPPYPGDPVKAAADAYTSIALITGRDVPWRGNTR